MSARFFPGQSVQVLTQEEIVANIHAMHSQLRAVQVLTWRTVCDQLPKILPDTAADIQVPRAPLQPLEHGAIRGLLAKGEVEKAELADTRVGEDVPGLVTLVQNVSS